jgi:excisionase family DNA binding protein
MDKLVSTTTVAKRLGIANARVYELARLGLIPHVRIGRTVRFDTERVEAWIRDGGRALPGGWRWEAP